MWIYGKVCWVSHAGLLSCVFIRNSYSIIGFRGEISVFTLVSIFVYLIPVCGVFGLGLRCFGLSVAAC